MQKKKWLAGFVGGALALSFMPSQARAWGDDGHRIVAKVAAKGLTSKTRSAVRKLLDVKYNYQVERTMGSVSDWADDVRTWQKSLKKNPNASPPSSLDNDELAADFVFNQKNENQPSWHFLNLPKDYVGPYSANLPGVAKENIVTAIRECVAVLKSPGGGNERINKKQALRLLIHYVGDIHQPLHAGCGYYKIDGSEATLISGMPSVGAKNDLGANAIELTNFTTKYDGEEEPAKLHSFWDGSVVNAARKITLKKLELEPDDNKEMRYVEHLSSALVTHWRFQAEEATDPGDWAVESVAVAKTIYSALKPGTIQMSYDQQRKSLSGKAQMRDDYLTDENVAVQANVRLSRAGFRLAATLNAIFD